MISEDTSLPCVATGAAFLGAKSESEPSEPMVAKLRVIVIAADLMPLFAIGLKNRITRVEFLRRVGYAPTRINFSMAVVLKQTRNKGEDSERERDTI